MSDYNKGNVKEVFEQVQLNNPTLHYKDWTEDTIKPFLLKDVDVALWLRTLKNQGYVISKRNGNRPKRRGSAGKGNRGHSHAERITKQTVFNTLMEADYE